MIRPTGYELQQLYLRRVNLCYVVCVCVCARACVRVRVCVCCYFICMHCGLGPEVFNLGQIACYKF